MNGESFKHNLLWKYATDALPKLLYSNEVSRPKLHNDLRYFKFGIICYFFVFVNRGPYDRKLNRTPPPRPNPQYKCILLGRVGYLPQLTQLRTFKLNAKLQDVQYPGRADRNLVCVQGHPKVIRYISDYYKLRHISSKRLVVEKTGQG